MLPPLCGFECSPPRRSMSRRVRWDVQAASPGLSSTSSPAQAHACACAVGSSLGRHHKAMLALHYMHYNFGRIHKTLRVTPAMEAGKADHVWSLEEIAGLAA